MYKKRKAFSFIEMLIVLLIIGVLFMAFRSSFQIKNKDILYSQACIETVYGQINNFINAGLSSKSLSTGNVPIFPDQYIINFDPALQTIQLKYKLGHTYYIYSNITFTGNFTVMYCSSNSYIIEFT